MLTIRKEENQPLRGGEDSIFVEIRGLSTDDKPTEYYDKEIGNGSTYIEIDTGKIYMYDADTEEWKEM